MWRGTAWRQNYANLDGTTPAIVLIVSIFVDSIARRLLVDGLNHGGVVLIAQAVVRKQLARHDEQRLRSVRVQGSGGQRPGIVRGEHHGATHR